MAPEDAHGSPTRLWKRSDGSRRNALASELVQIDRDCRAVWNCNMLIHGFLLRPLPQTSVVTPGPPSEIHAISEYGERRGDTASGDYRGNWRGRTVVAQVAVKERIFSCILESDSCRCGLADQQWYLWRSKGSLPRDTAFQWQRDPRAIARSRCK